VNVSVDLLDLPAHPAYFGMTFPHFRSLLEADSARTIPVGAHLEDEPLGLALAEADSGAGPAQVQSLYVVKRQRRQGIAGKLIRRLEEELRQRGCSHVGAVYAATGTSFPALERLVRQFEWSPPAPSSLIAKISQEGFMADDHLRSMAALEPPFSICAWQDVTPREREQIRRSQDAAPWIPPELDAFKNEEGADLRTSVALRHGSEVVGWILNHELDPETGRVTCACVRGDLQRTPSGARPLMALAAEAARRGIAIGHHYAIWVVNVTQPKMARFTERVLSPHAVSLQETRYTQKEL
jgi:GNAT superfamily N-acetyltransferase